MGDDKHNDDLPDGIDPEIEARVAALVLGDVSGPEVEELERMILEQPGLQEYRGRLASLHGMLGEALVPGDEEEWKLSPDRRAQLPDAFLAADPLADAAVTGGFPVDPARERRIRSAGRRVMWSAAACFGLTLFLVTFLTQPWMAFETEPGVEKVDRVTQESLSVSRSPMEVQESVGVAGAFSAEGEADPADGKINRLRIPLASKKMEKASEDSLEEHDILEADLGVDDEASADPVAPREEPGASRRKARAITESVPAPPAPEAASALSNRPRDLPSAGQPAQAAELLQEPAEAPAQDFRTDDAPQLPREKKPEERRREVAFLGLGVLLGLALGLAFGLGLGRTWQRRAQSSH